MASSALIIPKKIFSLALILNSLVSLACVAQILFNFYRAFPFWQPYSPYLVNGSVLFVVVVAAVLNISPSAKIGSSLHTGRFLFHHYVYGVLIIVFSAVFVVAFTSVSLPNLFLVYTSNIPVNFARFFVLAGLTLLLDDVSDVSTRVKHALNSLRSKAYQIRRVIHWLQFFSGLVTFYVFVAVCLWTTQNTVVAVQASFMIGTFLVTSIISFACVKRKDWLKILP